MSLYHVQKGIPSSILSKLPASVMGLRYSAHADNARKTDKYGLLPEVKFINFDAQVIEVETIGDEPIKVVYRQSCTEQIDLCVVVYLQSKNVATVWANEVNDTHSTLNLSKYD